MELSFWVGRQPPCLQYHNSYSTDADDDARYQSTDDKLQHDMHSEADKASATSREQLIAWQQKLQQQRQLRKQAVAAQQAANSAGGSRSEQQYSRRSTSKHRQDSSGLMQDGADPDMDTDKVQVNQLQGQLLWWLLLSAAAYSIKHGKKVFVAAAVVTLAGMLYLLGTNFLVNGASEHVISGLTEALESGTWQGWLVGVTHVSVSNSKHILLTACCMRLRIVA